MQTAITFSGCHRGVQTLEQRQSADTTVSQCSKIRNMTGKEGMPMTKPNTSGTPKPHSGLSNLFLLALHVGVLVVSLWVHPISLYPAGRALPYDIKVYLSINTQYKGSDPEVSPQISNTGWLLRRRSSAPANSRSGKAARPCCMS